MTQNAMAIFLLHVENLALKVVLLFVFKIAIPASLLACKMIEKYLKIHQTTRNMLYTMCDNWSVMEIIMDTSRLFV